MLKTEAISVFLTKNTHPDLSSLYNYNMEVQVNVAQEGGERIQSEYKGRRWSGWTDGIQTWKPFRIPFSANSNPTYEDTEMTYDLGKYVEGIGMTGWDWFNKLSRWFAYDFDAVTGHSDKHTKKLTEDELKKLVSSLTDIPWVTVRKSTSGSGLHLYVMLTHPEPTSTHTEHAALSRAVLGKLSAEAGIDLFSTVDICGQNMWVWHRKMLGTDGLTVIKPGVTLDEVPINWRDHMDVVTRKRRRVLPAFIKESAQDENERLFDELSGMRSKTDLDEEHKKLLKFLEEYKDFMSWFDADNNMLVTHTKALKDAHTALGFRGVFETTSKGTDATQNCFCYPMNNGSWAVRRFSRGVEEHPIWEQDRNGWTKCFFNRNPDLATISKYHGAVENPKGGYIFNEGESAGLALAALGSTLKIEPAFIKKKTKLKETKDGRVIVEIESTDADLCPKTWVREGKKISVITTINSPPRSEVEVGNFDDIVRHVISESNVDEGWKIYTDNKWVSEPMPHVKSMLKTHGLIPQEVDDVIGSAIIRPWTMVNKPFQSEYPGEREWNYGAAQYRYTPSQDLDNLNYKTWTKVLDHVGSSLDEYVQKEPWCKANAITTGSEYLLCWIASCFQYPEEPLPYLFLYGPQNSGKSILHEALELLVTKGVMRADQALKDPTFNGEIESAIICVIEETDLSSKGGKQAYNRIKDWVTARMIPIRKLYKDLVMIKNTTHWIQCANHISFCPVFPDDTRITMIYVPSLKPQDMVAKRDLILALKREAADFLAAILNLEVPDCKDRLRIPIITTEDKISSEAANMSPLEKFIKEMFVYEPGEFMQFDEFYNLFLSFATPDQVLAWSKFMVKRNMDRDKHPVGMYNGIPTVGNIARMAGLTKNKFKLVLSGQSLIQEDI